MPEVPIQTVGLLHEPVQEFAWEADLPNGKRIVVHLPRPLRPLASSLGPGIRVLLEMTPYDFDKARIAGLADDA
jgi:translation initiation factor IF-1